jgi:hypothetical protein
VVVRPVVTAGSALQAASRKHTVAVSDRTRVRRETVMPGEDGSGFELLKLLFQLVSCACWYLVLQCTLYFYAYVF